MDHAAPIRRSKLTVLLILNGLAWLETECTKRFNKSFAELTGDQQHQICDDIHYSRTAKPEFRTAAAFFSRFRLLCASWRITRPQKVGKAIGYVGNVSAWEDLMVRRRKCWTNLASHRRWDDPRRKYIFIHE